MRYELLNLIQGSPEWLAARFEHVTASNVACLAGISPYKTALEYATELLTRTAKEEGDKSFIYERGHAVEAGAREWAKANLGFNPKAEVVRSLDIPYFMASLDGMDAEKGIVFEAKYMGKDALGELKSGKIKEHHRIQVQAQLLATGFDKAIYFGMDPDGEAAVIEIAREQKDATQIAALMDKFWKDLKAGTLPKPSAKDIQSVEDPQIMLLAELDAQLSTVQDQYDELKKEILAKYAKNLRTIECGGVSISKSWRKGTTDWASLAKAKGIDESEQERFRKAGSLVTTIRVKKGA